MAQPRSTQSYGRGAPLIQHATIIYKAGFSHREWASRQENKSPTYPLRDKSELDIVQGELLFTRARVGRFTGPRALNAHDVDTNVFSSLNGLNRSDELRFIGIAEYARVFNESERQLIAVRYAGPGTLVNTGDKHIPAGSMVKWTMPDIIDDKFPAHQTNYGTSSRPSNKFLMKLEPYTDLELHAQVQAILDAAEPDRRDGDVDARMMTALERSGWSMFNGTAEIRAKCPLWALVNACVSYTPHGTGLGTAMGVITDPAAKKAFDELNQPRGADTAEKRGVLLSDARKKAGVTTTTIRGVSSGMLALMHAMDQRSLMSNRVFALALTDAAPGQTFHALIRYGNK